jgi:hypothetical protein
MTAPRRPPAETVVLIGRRVEAPSCFSRFRRSPESRADSLRRAATLGLSAVIHLLILVLLVEAVGLAASAPEERGVTIAVRRERPVPVAPTAPPAPVAAEPAAPAPAAAPPASPAPSVPVAPAPAVVGTGTAFRPPAAVQGDVVLALHDLGAAESPSAPGPYALRTPSERLAAAARHGGNAASESAVELGLQWLAAHAGADGRWSASGPPASCPTPGACYAHRGSREADAGVSGLALLAFLGAGYDHRSGPHRATVEKGLRGLLGLQHASGWFFDPAAVGAGNQGEMYGHGMALFALAEAAAMTGDPGLRGPLERALRATAAGQQKDGGWTYQPDAQGQRGELTLTVWVIQALEAAGRAEAPGAAPMLARARDFLLRSHVPGGGFTYTSASRPTLGSTGAGLFASCRLGLGDAVALDGGLRALAAQEKTDPALGEPRGWHSIYAWYYRTLASFQAQGRPWREWNRKLRPFLVSTQNTGGHAAGSWGIIDYASGSTVYSTALCVLMLETYYRYPLQTAGASVRGLSLSASDESAPLTREEERRIERVRPPTPEALEARRRRDLAEARADLKSERPERRYFASRRLAELQDRDSVEDLIGAARLESGRLRAAHLTQLGKLGAERALPFLEGELESDDADARAAALGAVSAITGEYLADTESARRLLRARRGAAR